MGYIYILTSPSGKSYIGQTIRSIHKRLEEHETGKSKDCRGIYNAIQKHGWDNFEKDWYYCPDDDLNKHEELMVEVLATLVPGGYNLKEGGGNHGKMSEETKQKMSESKKGEKHPMYGKTCDKCCWYGKTHTEETKQKMSEARLGEKNPFYGKTHTEETKQKMSESLNGKTHTDDAKQKMSEARLGEKNHMSGKTHTEETKQKMNEATRGDKNHNSKRVYQYDLDGNLLRSFGSTGEAQRYLDKPDGTCIRKCANGVEGNKTAYGFKWSYIKC